MIYIFLNDKYNWLVIFCRINGSKPKKKNYKKLNKEYIFT